MSVEFKDVSYIHSKKTPFATQGLDHINLILNQGEWAVLMGPTGAGKSTFLQHLNGLLKPDSGKVLLHGQSVHSSKEALRMARRKVGLVFQYPEHQLFGGTVWEEVSYGPLNFGLPEVEEKVKWAMALVGLDFEKFRDREPYQLSGGEKRRVALAGVLAQKPDVIALDEPTAGLDAEGRRMLIQAIADLNREYQVTVIWVTHEAGELFKLADRLILMNRGKIALDQTLPEAVDNPLLNELGLDVPMAAQIAGLLRKRGRTVTGHPLTAEEIKREILRLG